MSASVVPSILRLAACLLLAAPAAFSQTLNDVLPSVDVVRNRLSLTSQQEEILAPLFQQRMADIQAARAKLEKAASRTEKNSVLRDEKAAAQAFNTQVESVLDSTQKSEWRELREQTRAKVKERYEQKRESQ